MERRKRETGCSFHLFCNHRPAYGQYQIKEKPKKCSARGIDKYEGKTEHTYKRNNSSTVKHIYRKMGAAYTIFGKQVPSHVVSKHDESNGSKNDSNCQFFGLGVLREQ